MQAFICSACGYTGLPTLSYSGTGNDQVCPKCGCPESCLLVRALKMQAMGVPTRRIRRFVRREHRIKGFIKFLDKWIFKGGKK